MDRLKLLDASLRAFDASVPDVTASSCLATRYRGSPCRRCLDVCPSDALVTSPRLELDPDKCLSCGACAAVCPTGAVQRAVRSGARRAEVQARAAEEPSTAVIACCRVDPARVAGTPLVLRCLGGLSTSDLIAAAALGLRRISLVSGACPECPEAVAGAALERAVSAACETLTVLELTLRLERARSPARKAPAATTPPAVSRRGLFGYVAQGLTRSVATGAAPPAPQRSISALHKQTAPPAAHRRLLRDLTALQARGGGRAVRLPASLPLADVSVLPECDACGLCLRYCPHGALATHGSSVAADRERCTACGLCAEVCPRSAVRIAPATLAPQRPPSPSL
jgi:ferredoxin